MKKGKKLLAFAISLLTMVTTIFSNTMSVHAEDTTGLKFTKIEVTDTAGNVKADLLAGFDPGQWTLLYVSARFNLEDRTDQQYGI